MLHLAALGLTGCQEKLEHARVLTNSKKQEKTNNITQAKK